MRQEKLMYHNNVGSGLENLWSSLRSHVETASHFGLISFAISHQNISHSPYSTSRLFDVKSILNFDQDFDFLWEEDGEKNAR
jgi:hypothetical protein